MKNVNLNKKNMNLQNSFDKLQLYSVDEGFVKGNLFVNLYQGYQGYTPQLAAPSNLEEAMMHEIQKYTFAAHDLNLYLDNNPDDARAIELFNEYQKMAKEAIQNYEKEFGPISLSSNKLDTVPWGWHKTNWPWGGDK